MNKIYTFCFIIVSLFVFNQKLYAQCAFTSTVPYLESFNGISYNNQLPTCWISNNASVCLTFTAPQNSNALPHMGNQFAAFANVAGTNFFYSNGVYLNKCVNYSVSIWYLTGSNASTNFTNLSILLASGQSSVNATTLASTNSIVSSPTYTNLTATFIVASNGVYYFAIRAVCNGSTGANYLSWDDFSIDAPASINVTPISVQVSPTVMCAGGNATLTATGVQTFTWSNGANTSSIVVSPSTTTNFSVAGTSTSSACVYASQNASVFVPVPSFTISPPNPSLCIGKSISLLAFGTNSYLWSNGANGSILNITPTVSTIYTVVGTNQYGCNTTKTTQVVVWPLPTISVIPSNTLVCAGEVATITATGANNYTWTALINSQIGFSMPIIQPFNSLETFSVVGADLNGCINSSTVSLYVNQCAGINERLLQNGLYVYPNPFTKEIIVLGLNHHATVSIFDLSGRLLRTEECKDIRMHLDLTNLAKGMYHLRINTGVEIIERKIIKD